MGPTSRTFVGDLCLEDMGIVVERIHDMPPIARVETTDVAGRDGTVLNGLTYEPRTITLECRVFRDRWHEFDRIVDELAGHLMTGEEVYLSTRNHPGEHYMAYLESITEGDREYGGSGIGYLELSFVASDPWRTGVSREVTVPSGGSVTFHVGGTKPASVLLSSDAATRNQASLVWGVRFDENDFLHVATGSGSSVSVSIDSRTRRVSVSGATSMVTLDSDWPELAPGTHVARMDEGTGAATLAWTERSA